MTKFTCANFQKHLSASYIILRMQRLEANSVDLDEVAHYEPPHQNLRCLQIQLFSSLVVKELRTTKTELVKTIYTRRNFGGSFIP